MEEIKNETPGATEVSKKHLQECDSQMTTINVNQVAKEIIEILHENGIAYNSIDYVFECAKELAHVNRIAYPLCFSKKDNPL